jgi:hypothetical protein
VIELVRALPVHPKTWIEEPIRRTGFDALLIEITPTVPLPRLNFYNP